LGMPWFQMTYWSLAVEFQYYLFVGLVFPLLAQKGLAGSLLMYLLFAIASLSLGHNHELLPHHLPLFLMGITVFRFKCSISNRWELALGMIFTAALAVVVEGSLEAMVGLASCGAILFVNASSRLLNFLGNISYSLYLMHVFVGQTVFGLAMKFPGSIGWMKWVVPWFALALAILVAYSLYRLVEQPSKRWSAALRYGTPARQQSLSLETAERAA